MVRETAKWIIFRVYSLLEQFSLGNTHEQIDKTVIRRQSRWSHLFRESPNVLPYDP